MPRAPPSRRYRLSRRAAVPPPGRAGRAGAAAARVAAADRHGHRGGERQADELRACVDGDLVWGRQGLLRALGRWRRSRRSEPLSDRREQRPCRSRRAAVSRGRAEPAVRQVVCSELVGRSDNLSDRPDRLRRLAGFARLARARDAVRLEARDQRAARDAQRLRGLGLVAAVLGQHAQDAFSSPRRRRPPGAVGRPPVGDGAQLRCAGAAAAIGAAGVDAANEIELAAMLSIGRCSGRISGPSHSSSARSTTLRTSRTLPGHG